MLFLQHISTIESFISSWMFDTCVQVTIILSLMLVPQKQAAEHSSGSSKGIAFLLQADLSNNQESTYQKADNLAKTENDAIPSEFQMFLQSGQKMPIKKAN